MYGVLASCGFAGVVTHGSDRYLELLSSWVAGGQAAEPLPWLSAWWILGTTLLSMGLVIFALWLGPQTWQVFRTGEYPVPSSRDLYANLRVSGWRAQVKAGAGLILVVAAIISVAGLGLQVWEFVKV